LLFFSVAVWSFQLIVDAFPSGKAVGSFRGDSHLEESLLVIFRIISVLRLELILFFSLSPEEDENKALGEEFLETENVETLLEECLVM